MLNTQFWELNIRYFCRFFEKIEVWLPTKVACNCPAEKYLEEEKILKEKMPLAKGFKLYRPKSSTAYVPDVRYERAKLRDAGLGSVDEIVEQNLSNLASDLDAER